MKYVSLDLETTGLDPENNQILEFAAVFEDAANLMPIDKLPFFHCYMLHERLVGHPVAIAMNAGIIANIANKERIWHGSDIQGKNFLKPIDLWEKFHVWLTEVHKCMLPPSGKGRRQVTLAGKNPAFDRGFCQKLPDWQQGCFYHRVADPGVLYTDFVKDVMIPDTSACAARAGVSLNGLHSALEDARRIIELIRKGAKYGLLADGATGH